MQKLEAVNQMLQEIGQTPVTTIIANQHPAVLAALTKLNFIDKRIQSKGWWFNTNYNLTLSYDPNTLEITIPANTLSVDPSDILKPYTARGTRLYDYATSTYAIGANVDVDIIQQLQFEELPEVCAQHITVVAAHAYVRVQIGDETKMAELREEIKFTWSDLRTKDITHRDITLATNPSVARLMTGIRPSF